MISSLLHLVGLRPLVYYTLTNFSGGGGQGPLAPPPQYANEYCVLFLEHKLIMDSVRLQMCKDYLNGHQDVHISQYSVLIVFLFNPFVYYYILSHTRPIMTRIYATVDYRSDLNHIHSLTINVKLSLLRSYIISSGVVANNQELERSKISVYMVLFLESQY